MTSFTDQAGHASTYTYDLDGNRTNVAYPTSVTGTVTYDAANRPVTLKDGSGTTLATNTFDTLDRVTAVIMGVRYKGFNDFDFLDIVKK